MKRLLALAGCVGALIGSARADEARIVPAAGSSLTFRSVSTTKYPSGSITVGHIASYIVKSSDGITAEGVIRLRAMIYGCPPGPSSSECTTERKAPNGHQEGDLLVVPIPEAVADNLERLSAFRLGGASVLELNRFPVAGAKSPDDPEIGLEPLMVATWTRECDQAGLQKFFPIGSISSVTVPCTTGFARTRPRTGHSEPIDTSDADSMELSYHGTDRVTLPSGDWDVQKLSIKTVPKIANHVGTEREILFSPKLGIGVRSHSTGADPEHHASNESSFELIAVSP